MRQRPVQTAQQLTDRLNLPDDGRHRGLLIMVQRHGSLATWSRRRHSHADIARNGSDSRKLAVGAPVVRRVLQLPGAHRTLN
jgi:hypothetical protein